MKYTFRFIAAASVPLDTNFVLIIFLVAITAYLAKQLKEGKAWFDSQCENTVHPGWENMTVEA